MEVGATEIILLVGIGFLLRHSLPGVKANLDAIYTVIIGEYTILGLCLLVLGIWEELFREEFVLSGFLCLGVALATYMIFET